MEDQKEVRIVREIEFDPFLRLEVKDEITSWGPCSRRIVTVYSCDAPVLDLLEEELFPLAIALLKAMKIE